MTVLAVGLAGLLEVVVVSMVAGVGVTVAFSLFIVGAVHSNERRREGQQAASFAWGVLALAAMLAVAAAVVAGLQIVAS